MLDSWTGLGCLWHPLYLVSITQIMGLTDGMWVQGYGESRDSSMVGNGMCAKGIGNEPFEGFLAVSF